MTRYKCIKAYPGFEKDHIIVFQVDSLEDISIWTKEYPEYWEPIEEEKGKIATLGGMSWTTEDLTIKLNELIDHLNALEAKTEKPVVAKERWRAEKGRDYWYLDEFDNWGVGKSYENRDQYDDKRYATGNMFPTKEQAEQAAELVKQTLINFHNSLNND